MSPRVLVLASEVVPLPGLPTTGGGLRGWTLARGLEAAGFEVVLVFPREPLAALAPELSREILDAAQPHTFAWADPAAAIAAHHPDVVVCCSWILASQLDTCPVPLAVDVAGPMLLEFLYQNPEKAAALGERKPRGLGLADYVTCAGERQRAYFYPWLMFAGFDRAALEERVGVVPISTAPGLPASPPPGNPEPRILFAGLALPWQDPSVPLRAVLDALDRRGRGVLDCYVSEHPVHSHGVTWLAQLRERAKTHPRLIVRENRPRPYATMLELFRQADLAFDLFARNPERELAFNTRTVDYLACGVPPLYSDYAELATAITRYDAGVTVDPADPAAIALALDALLDDPDGLAARRANARHLVDDHLTWDRTIAPLAAWCAVPTRRVRGPLIFDYLEDMRREVRQVRDLLSGAEDERARALLLASERAEYAKQLETAWREQGTRLTALDTALATWRAAPWRGALRQTYRAVRPYLPGRRSGP